MTKLPQSYDELELDERPRVCGGAVFLKLMKKAKCSSYTQKHESPMLTSSSSFSSSQTSSMIEYDPNKAHFCMPAQTNEDGYKLNFKLQEEENSDFLHNYHDVDRSALWFGEQQSHEIVTLNPQAINQLKTKHLQSMNDNWGKETSVEPRNVLSSENKSRDIGTADAAWNEVRTSSETPSKANSLRQEMSSFRKELRAVKRSLPNQFEINFFEEDDSVENRMEESSKHDPEGSKQDSEEQAEAQYFKSDWNLSFHSLTMDPSESIHTDCNDPPESANQNIAAIIARNAERAALEPKESFPECPEMPFDNQGSNLELQSSSLEERDPAASSIEDTRASPATDSNYEKDMELVQMLLKKYADKIGDDDDERKKLDKARRLRAILDQPSDAWFHRHASGVCKKTEKLSVPDSDIEASSPSQTISRKPDSSVPERVKQAYQVTTTAMLDSSVPEKVQKSDETPKPAAPKKTVHFNDVNEYVYVEALEDYSVPNYLKSAPGLKTRSPPRLETRYEDNYHRPAQGNTLTTAPDYTRRSPGKLSAKIKYWEQKKI